MRIGIRIIILTALLALAVTMATFTIAGFTNRSAARAGSLYLLGEKDGNVAVFGGEDPETPLEVTGIEISSLRERDRELIAAGLPVDSREELARLLEDLGS